MKKKELLQLADLLDTVNLNNFDMFDWGRESSCGFVGCAGGHATTIFPELTMVINDTNTGMVVYQDKINYNALAAFFEIDIEYSYYIFKPENYIFKPEKYEWYSYKSWMNHIKPSDVTERIREIANG